MSAVARTGLSRYAYQGHHRSTDSSGTAARTTARSAALSAGVVAAVMAGTAAPATAASTDDPWAKLRQCESGGNYSINTGNGYYGAYQFNLGTWRAYGGTGLPSNASRAEQDYRAKLLYRARGWAPWPACSRRLGLGEDPAYGIVATAPAARPAYQVTLSGPRTARLRSVYRVTGRARPDSAITVRIRAGGHHAWHAFAKRTNGKGRFSVAWRARTDYQFQVVAGGVSSPIRTTRIATTAGAVPTVRLAASSAGPAATVRGTARPNAKMILFVRTARGRWRTWTKFATGASGRWSLDLAAPAPSVRFYAKSANGLRSTITSLRA